MVSKEETGGAKMKEWKKLGKKKDLCGEKALEEIYVEEQTKDICLAVMMKNGRALQYVKCSRESRKR